MTGAYLRVKRGEQWENIEVEHLTDSERQEVLGGRPPYELVQWLNMACKKLAEIQPLLDELEREGIIGKQN